MSKSGLKNLKMKSVDMTDQNIEKIADLFPGVITEIEDEDGNLKKGIDFDLLKQELSADFIEGREERYDFTWVGKRQAIIEANRPINKTLRPCMEESKDWENTENIYIEGDNLDALKLLQESYLNSLKMIYIDPPYNTGKDFIYNDRFVMDSDEYDEETCAYDEAGNRMFKNSKDRGRYHSDWCSMLYPRLKLAHNLLRDDGVIFVSIDDHEVHNLRKIMDEIFGEENFVANIVWQRAFSPVNLKKKFSESHDYIICYCKEAEIFTVLGLKRTETSSGRYSNYDSDPRGPWTSTDLSVGPVNRANVYPIKTPSGRIISPPEGRCWVLSKERFNQKLLDKRIWFGKNGDNTPRLKTFLMEVKSRITPMTFWVREDTGDSQEATRELKLIFDGKLIIDYPKPTRLLKRLGEIISQNDDIILDFFSGSATTAHTVMKLNSEDGGNRKFIMVQLPEACDEKSDAYKAGFKNIAEIGKERIRRAGEQIKNEIEAENKQATLDGEPKKVPDIGFRLLKVDDTNMKDVYYSAGEYSQETIEGLVDNVKEDRKDIDLLYQIILDWGLPLNHRHEIEEIDGFTIHIVDNDSLVACFESNIPESVMRKIAEKKPLRAVFRDGSFRDSPGKLNIEGIFKTIAPDTKLRVI